MTRKLIKIAAISFAALIVIGAGIVFFLARSGAGTVEKWIGSQVQTIANSYLNPHLSFTDLDYQYPLTVSLKHLHLTADDPVNPGKKIDIVGCDQAVLSLAEIPSIGKPIVIEKIVLDKPLFSAVAVAPGSKQFVGFSNLIKGSGAAPAPAEPNPADKAPAAPQKLSDIFRMKLVQLNDGKIVYDPRIPGTIPMELDQINTALNISATDEGWYKLSTVIAREPVFKLQVDGQLNLDTFNVRDFALGIQADLGSDKLSYLPPELQQLLRQYDARGKLQLQIASKAMPVMDPLKGDVEAEIKVGAANLTVGELKLPVDNLDLVANYADGKVTLPSLKITALDGTADLSGSTTLNDRLDADLHLKIAGMMLEKALARQTMSSSAGRLDLEFNVAGSLKSIIGKAPAPPNAPLASINLKNFRFSADDPANPGQKIDVVACQNLDVALLEPILPGKPIVIEKIILDQPALSVIAIAPNSAKFIGVPALQAPATAPAAPAPTPVAQAPAPKQRISDLFRVKTFQLNNAKLRYDPRIPGTQGMWLDQISTAVTLDPANPDVYKLAVNLGRRPVFDLSIATQVNLDALTVDDLKLNLQADLSQNQRDYLPPQLQAMLKQSDATGKIAVQVAAAFPIGDPMKGKMQIDARLENLNVASGDLRVPVKSLDLSARLENGNAQLSTLKIAALNSLFDVSGSAVLNQRIDSDLKVKLTGIVLEDLVAAIKPNQPRATTTTKLDAEIEVKSPIMVALGNAPRSAGEPVATLAVKNVHLTTNDPTAAGKPLEFVACDNLAVVLSALPQSGKPILIDRIALDHPTLRAVAMAANSNDFAGFVNLQRMAAAPIPAQSSTPAPAPASPSPTSQPQQKLSDLFRVQLVELNDAAIYYDARIANTVPMTLDHINTKINLDSASGETYAFTTTIPREKIFNLSASGKVNVDTLNADALKLTLATDLGQRRLDYLPPQLQQKLQQFDTAGMLNVNASGSMPLTNPTRGDLQANVTLDNLKVTAADFRIPVEHVRVPAHLKDGVLEFQPAATLGGPTVEALKGHADLTGIVMLNDHMDSWLVLNVDGMLLQELMAAKIHKGPKDSAQDLIGKLQAYVKLNNAPLLIVAAKASPAATQPSSPDYSPLSQLPMPDNWGTGTINITDARLVGLEVIQKMGNVARNLFANVFKKDDARSDTVNPREHADIKFDLVQDQIKFSQISYEGEVVAVDGVNGGGTITLAEALDLRVEGGPLQKLLDHSGNAGVFLQKFTNAMLIFHITGTAGQPNLDFERGDGQPVTEQVKNLAQKGGDAFSKGAGAVGTGLQKAGSAVGNAFDWLTGKKKEDGK